jgi:hypothetical protein
MLLSTHFIRMNLFGPGSNRGIRLRDGYVIDSVRDRGLPLVVKSLQHSAV